MSPTPDPSDNTTLTDVVQGYRQSGFVTDFHVEPAADRAAAIRCNSCQSVIEPARATIHSLRRLEGASDPADMTAVVATTCPVCGADGTIVLGYGPMAEAMDGDVLRAMSDHRTDDILPADQPPSSPAERVSRLRDAPRRRDAT